MSEGQVEALLGQGIQAAKKDEREEARNLFVSVLKVDNENEQAWLWLSSVVDTNEDKRICLENVLVLNPGSLAAKRGLVKLEKGEPSENANLHADQVVHRENKPISLASAVLYPERQIIDHQWHDPIKFQVQRPVEYRAHSSYDDIWEQDCDICQYCATEVTPDDKRCPNCRRSLFVSSFRYPKASVDLTIFLVLLLGLAQISLILVMISLLLRESLLSSVWQGVMFVVLAGLAVAVFLRQFWAYITSIVFLLLSGVTLLMDYFTGPEAVDVISEAVTSGFFRSLEDQPYIYVLQPLEQFLIPVQIVIVISALLFAIFKVGPDFERIKVRQVAQLDRGLSDASQYYSVGRDYEERGKLASAVLHFQKAAALDPTQLYYQRALGSSYARLGYYQRSLDVLESALHVATETIIKEDFEQLLALVRSEMAATETRGNRQVIA